MKQKKYRLQQDETRADMEKRIEAERRLTILSFIIEFSDSKGYAPSVRDIMPIAGLASSSTMHKVLSRMEKDKLIQVTQGVARSMRVLPKGLEMIS
jgi:SOS-response transcriptional repressor LexA